MSAKELRQLEELSKLPLEKLLASKRPPSMAILPLTTYRQWTPIAGALSNVISSR
jgi:hypothetical protein